jgi:uncharacterized protein DUF4136
MQHHFMPAPLRAVIGLLLITLLGACSSGPPKPTVDYNPEFNFMTARTIAFYKDSGMVSGDNPHQLSDMQRNRADKALRLALENKGFSVIEDASKADLLISWHLSTQYKTDVRTYQTSSYGGGYGGGYYGGYNRYSRYNCWSCSPTRTEVSVQDYTEGTFIVDIIDPVSHQSVWRGVTQSKLKGKQDAQQEGYNEAATVIFESFPP